MFVIAFNLFRVGQKDAVIDLAKPSSSMKRMPQTMLNFFPSSGKKNKTDETSKKPSNKEPNKESVKTNAKKEKETFTCLECMEKYYIQNRLDDIKKYATIARNDFSSIDRHKKRHHKDQENLRCSFVVTNSTKVRELENKYSKKDSIEGINSERKDEQTEPSVDQSETEPVLKVKAPLQSTLLDHAKGMSSDMDDPGSSVKDSQLQGILDKIEKLSIEFKDVKEHHKNVCTFAINNEGKTSALLENLRKSGNITEFMKCCDEFEWFYREDTELGVVRCKACYHLLTQKKPRLASMGPFELRHFVNENNYSSGIFLSKDQCLFVEIVC